MSFRQYGGINYAARNNIVKNNFTNASNLSIMNKVGQPDSKINVESTLDVYAINLTSPTITTNPNGVVPKSYVDLVGGGLKPKAACQCATTVALSGSDNPMIGTYLSLIIDGYTVVTGNRVLIKNQQDIPPSSSYTGSVYNGIYVYTIVSGSGTFARSSDYAIGDDAYGAYLLISNGLTNGNKNFIEINEGLVGTSVLLFTPFTASFAVGQGLEKVPLGSSTEVQVKSDLSNPPFITSLAVSGSITTSSASIGGGALTINSSGLVSSVSITSTSTVSGATLQSSGNIYLTNTSAFILTSTAGANLSVGTQSGGGLFLNANGITGIRIVGTDIINYLSTTFSFPPLCSVSATTGTQLVNKSYVDSTFQTIADMSLYLTIATASTTYLTIATASTTYLTTSEASATYQPIGSYLTMSDASITYAPLASPALTGTPTAPTAAAGTDSTQIATTAWVKSVSDYPYYTTPDTIAFYCSNPFGFAFPPNFNIKPNYSAGTFKTWRIEVSVLISPSTYESPPVLQAYGIADWTYQTSGATGAITHSPIVDNLYVNGVKQTASMFGGPQLSPTTITIGTINGFNYGSFNSVFFFTFGAADIQARFTFSQNNFTGTGTSQVELQAYARVISSSPFNYVAGSTGAYTFSPNSSNTNNGGGGGFWTS
jgi:hypothetical protein